MCNATPKRGETWVFRRDSWWTHTRDVERSGEGVQRGSEFSTFTGVFVRADDQGIWITTTRLAGESILLYKAGWEPFLRLEGETQERPTAPTWNVKHNLDPNTWEVVIEATMPPAPRKPKVGERWHFRSIGTLTYAWNGKIVGVGDGWWVGERGPLGPDLLPAAAWQPVRCIGSA